MFLVHDSMALSSLQSPLILLLTDIPFSLILCNVFGLLR